ncbi:MAG TPA: hypothetical protein VEY70_14170 [Metabacillus sp.]|nr:hypothetical protein [Metabacillus sp.]
MLSKRDIQSINLWISKMNHYNYQDKKQKIKNAKRILKLKHKIIGYGWHRIVYDLNNGYVLKVAISDHGLKSNETEYKVYTNCPYELREYLCPIKKLGHGWIIMRKMEYEVPNKRYIEELARLKNKFQNAGIIPYDLKKLNVMLSKEGKITVIDYGDFFMS